MRKRQRMISFVLTVIGLFLAVAFFSPILVLLNNSFKSLKNIYLDVLAFPTAETLSRQIIRMLLRSWNLSSLSAILL